jgi:predicted short-subunit dehydrogenase-like oxidoreductase (DUF2520 family)
MLRLAFIGAGKVGSALAIALYRAGYPVVAISSRTRAPVQRLAERVPGAAACSRPAQVAALADVVFLTVPDDAVRSLAEITPWRSGQMAVHCSGSLSLDVLEAATAAGALAGAIHPLQTFASVDNALQNLPGSTFGIEAANENVAAALEGMARALNGTPIRLGPGDKALYHASAVIACNYLVTLESLAAGLWQAFGVKSRPALNALMPLLRGTLSNLERAGLPDALTGPIARGDTGTVAKHLAALDQAAPELASLYRILGLHTIPIGLAKGSLSAENAEVLRRMLEVDRTNPRQPGPIPGKGGALCHDGHRPACGQVALKIDNQG